MNNIKETLATLLSYYTATKGCGHTAAMLSGAVNSPDCLVLVSGRPSLPKIHATRIVTLERPDLANGLIGVRAPLLLDNSAAKMLIADSLTEIERLARRCERLQKQLMLLDAAGQIPRTTPAENGEAPVASSAGARPALA